MKAVILVGGEGTRLRPLSYILPKAMMPVLGKPFLEHQIGLLKRNGVSDIVICIGHLGEKIKDYFGDGAKFGVRISYSDEGKKLMGTAGALKKAEALLGEAFFFMYGDGYLQLDYKKVMGHFRKTDKLGLMVVYKNFDKYDRSNVVVEGGMVKIYDKRKKFPHMDYIDFGVSVLRKKALSLIPGGEPVDLEALYQELIRRKQLRAFETEQRFFEIGSPESLREFEELVAAGKVKL